MSTNFRNITRGLCLAALVLAGFCRPVAAQVAIPVEQLTGMAVFARQDAAPVFTSDPVRAGWVNALGLGPDNTTAIEQLWDTLIAAAPANPVFVIQNWGQWTDLEIKGMTAGNVMIYFYHSPDPEKTTITGQIWDAQPRLWYTDTSTGGTNIRRWHMQNATQSIAAQLGDPANGYVGGWVIMIRGLDMTREELQQVSWSYALFDGASREEDALGRQIWRPIVPTDFQPDDYDPDD